MKNLNSYEHGIIPDILRLADRLNWCKLNISVPLVVARYCGSLESQQVRLSHQGLTDVVTVFSAIRLIQNGQGNSSRKGPFQNAVIISLHHMNKQRHVFSNTAIHTVQVDPHTQFVAVNTGVEGRAVDCCHHPTEGILAVLSIVIDLPNI